MTDSEIVDLTVVLQTQGLIGEQLTSIFSSFKKANKEQRRKIPYLTNKISEAEELFQKFKSNQESIGEVKDDSPYFQNNYFHKICELATSHIAFMKSHLGESAPYEAHDVKSRDSGENEPSFTIPSLDSDFNHVQEIRLQRNAIKEFNLKLQRLQGKSLSEKEQWLNVLKNDIISIKNRYDEIFVLMNNDNIPYDISSDIIYELENNLIVELSQLRPQPASVGSNIERAQYLPKIQIPKFNGDFLKWPLFKNLFNELVHSQPISDTRKIVYLHQNLIEEAGIVLGQADLTHESYEDTWKRIQETYDNKRRQTAAVANRFFNQPAFREEKSSNLKQLFNVTKESIVNLKSLGITMGECEPLFVHLLLKKLDDNSRQLFESKLENPRENPTMEHFLKFLEYRFQALEGLDKNMKGLKSTHIVSQGSETNCFCCKGSHKLFECKSFVGMDINKKWTFIKENKLCCLCFRKGHFANSCNWKVCPIKGCGRRHNKIMHEDQKKKSKVVSASSNVDSNSSAELAERSVNLTAQNEQNIDFIFLGTVLLKVEDQNKNLREFRALLDSGSQISFITEKCCIQLGLRPYFKHQNVIGIGGENSMQCNKRVNVKLYSNDFKFTCRIEAIVVPCITSYSPCEEINIDKILDSKALDVTLADPSFHCAQNIDLLLDGNVYAECIKGGKIHLGDGLPKLINSSFGWVVQGKYENKQRKEAFCGICNIPKLWDLEIEDRKVYSSEDQQTLNYFEETTEIINGRFQVSLPKHTNFELGESLDIAKSRFYNLEKRFERNVSLFEKYKEFIDEYISLKHMTEIKLNDIPKLHYFMPHHPVFKESSSTTKIRVVFDASARTSNNKSLNDMLLKGPTLQDELFNLLIRFRFPVYAMTADIEKMYRQIWVHPNDRSLQLIVWRSKPTEALKYFKLNTVTYGTKSAPFLAIKCLKSLSDYLSKTDSVTSNIIGNDFYVDDLITGFDDLTSALVYQKKLISALDSFGLKLRKWCANSQMLTESILIQDRETLWNLQEDETFVKTLGMIWNPSKDKFYVCTKNCSTHLKITKRIIASEAGQIFDPLGLVQPTVVVAKIMLQKIWQLKLDWDTQLPVEYCEYWEKFRKDLVQLKNVSINRHVLIQNFKCIELHGFCDASEKAYGAVVYVRSISQNGEIYTNILCSKSKLSPLSKKSIAKLELCGAKILAELVDKILKSIKYKIDRIFYWCDSKIVLSWLSNPSSLYKTFVGNRVAVIQELSSRKHWFHVPGEINPADLISRGAFPTDLLNSDIWFQGPQFLNVPESKWPICDNDLHTNNEEVLTEFKKVSLSISVQEKFTIFDKINHKNSFKVLCKIVSYIYRVISKSRKPKLGISANEQEHALKIIIKYIQHKYGFHHELHMKFKSLSPFIDSDGLIRVGGRLSNSHLSFDSKHPYLIPKCDITNLLLKDIHENNMHCGPQTLLSIVRQRFWPINGKRLVNQIFHNCVRCFRVRPKNISQLMGQLPEQRVVPSAPFSKVGVDFGGPFTVHCKGRGSKTSKVYVAVFVCFVVKAVHLEIVSDLTTQAFLDCLRRFVARRGKPVEIFSDNATNFTGARTELKTFREFFVAENNKIERGVEQLGITWKTIPPRSPHFGGLWEAAVKRAKIHLKDIVQNKNLTYEELFTAITEIEGVLNSRPLTEMSNNPNDLRALTPFDFLIQGQFSNLVEEKLANNPFDLQKRWKKIESIRKEFWHRWVNEYLHTLQQRGKWLKNVENIKLGTLVLLKDTNLTPLNWKLGRVVELFKGKDNFVRTVDVKTENGIKRRAITEISPLPKQVYDDSFKKDNLEAKKMSVTCNISCKEICKKRNTESENKYCNNDILFKVKNYSKSNSQSYSKVTLFCLFALLIVPILGNNIDSDINLNVKIHKNHPGLYFNGIGNVKLIENRWHLIMFYNLSTYWAQCSRFLELAEVLKPACQRNYCSHTLEEIQHQINDIMDMNAIIKKECHLAEYLKTSTNRTRTKRGAFNILGNIANAIGGVLDDKYAERVEDTFKRVQNREVHMMELIKNQTFVIDSTVRIIKKSNDEIVQQFNKLSTNVDNMKQTLETQQKSILLNNLISYFILITHRYREIQMSIHNVLLQFKSGKLNSLLISPDELEEQVKNIQLHVSHRYEVPSFHFEELEKILDVAVVHGKNSLIFQIEIPLLELNTLKLYRMIPLPTIINSEFAAIKPVVDYLAINVKEKTYYLMTDDDYKQCSFLKEITFCSKNHPEYTTEDEAHCEVNLFLHDEGSFGKCTYQKYHSEMVWIELKTFNEWLFSVKKKITVKYECGDYITRSVIESEGVIKLDPGCTLIVNGAKIIGKENLTSSYTTMNIPSFLPQLNMSLKSNMAEVTQPLILKQANLNDVSNMIEDLKLNALRDNINDFFEPPSIHSCVTYCILSLISIIFVIFIYYRFREKGKRGKNVENSDRSTNGLFNEIFMKSSPWTRKKTLQRSLPIFSTRVPQRSASLDGLAFSIPADLELPVNF